MDLVAQVQLVLDPLTNGALRSAADDLVGHLRRQGPDVGVAQRPLGRS